MKKNKPSDKLKAKLGKILSAFPKESTPDRLAQVAVELKPQSALRAEYDSHRKPKKAVEAYVLRLPGELMRELRCASHSLRISMAKISEDALARYVERLKDEHLAMGREWIEPPPKKQNRNA